MQQFRYWPVILLLSLALNSAASPDTYTVTSVNDSGEGTLRWAVLEANGRAGEDTIEFAISGRGPHTILLSTGPIVVFDDLTINGTTQAEISVSGQQQTQVARIYDCALTIRDLTITDGRVVDSPYDGGAIRNIGGDVSLVNCTITNCFAVRAGGAIYSLFGNLSLDNCVLVANESGAWGGAIRSHNSTTIARSLIANNSTGVWGGGVHINGTATIVESTIANNWAEQRGGGIHNHASTVVSLIDSTIVGNSVEYGGGTGIKNAGVLTMQNCTVSGNAGLWRGAIENSCELTMHNCTVSANSSGATAGVNTSLNSTTNLINTIVANSQGGGVDLDNRGILNAMHSLIEDGLVEVNGTNLNNLTGDPKLGPLKDNGGLTKTHALLPGSIAIDAGTCIDEILTDQRGEPRPSGGGCDIGAYERQPPPHGICAPDVVPPNGGNGIVNVADLLYVVQNFGTPDGDVDGDGDTDVNDLLAVIGAWGQCP